MLYMEKDRLHKGNKFEISAPTQNDKSELCEESYSVSDVQDYFQYIIKEYEKL